VMAASGLVVNGTQGSRETAMLLAQWGLGCVARPRCRALSAQVSAHSKVLPQVGAGQGFGARAVSPAVWSGLH